MEQLGHLTPNHPWNHAMRPCRKHAARCGALIPLFIFIFAIGTVHSTAHGQSTTSATSVVEYPEAPVPMVAANAASSGAAFSPRAISISISPPAARRHEARKWERMVHAGLAVAFPAALTADMVSTYLTETHPLHVSYHMTICNIFSNNAPPTQGPCPPAVENELVVNDLSTNGAFQEYGWARVFGPRNAPATIGANVGLDVLMALVDRRLWHTGREPLRKIDLAAIGYKATNHVVLAIENMRSIHQTERNAVPPGAIDVRWY